MTIRFLVLLGILTAHAAATDGCELMTIKSSEEFVSICNTEVNGRVISLSEGCTDCLAKKAYIKSRKFEPVDDDRYGDQVVMDYCKNLHGNVVIGKGSTDHILYFCQYPKDGSFIYGPNLVP